MAKNFEKWFRAQYGNRPVTEKKMDSFLDRLAGLRFDLREAEERLANCRRWDDLQNAALYAWNAAGKDN